MSCVKWSFWLLTSIFFEFKDVDQLSTIAPEQVITKKYIQTKRNVLSTVHSQIKKM